MTDADLIARGRWYASSRPSSTSAELVASLTTALEAALSREEKLRSALEWYRDYPNQPHGFYKVANTALPALGINPTTRGEEP